jgi:TolB protein
MQLKKWLGLILFFVSSYTLALNLEVTKGLDSALPIGVISFSGSKLLSSEQDVSKIVEQDLTNSGQFKVVTAKDDLLKSNAQYWKSQGVNYVVSGKVQKTSNGDYYVSFELTDPISHSQTLLNQDYHVAPKDLRTLAHHISDKIYQQLTGEKGIFSTRLAYVVHHKQGKNQAKRYTLEITDADGHNPRVLLTSSQPIMSPAWSPDGKEIAYVSFENKKSEIYAINVQTGQRERLTSFPGINGAPAWSPDGKRIALVLSKDGSPNLYLLNKESKRLTKLTNSAFIDTEPDFLANGNALIFTSNRGGAPQIYRLNLANHKVNRLTFDGNYNARARVTPKNKALVMMHRFKHHFAIGVQPLSTNGDVKVLTSGNDESPSVSPNGRMILYSSNENGQQQLKIVSIDGKVNLNLPSNTQGDIQEPAWSPYL